MSRVLSQLPKYKAGDIYNILKKNILCLELLPGQLISENEISKSFDVSRTIVRTAFSELQKDKLIIVLPQRGTYISYLDYKYIMDTVYMRYTIELDIFSGIQNKISSSCDKLLINNTRKQESICQSINNLFQFNDLDEEFHRIYYELAGRKNCWKIIKDFQVSYTRFRLLDMITLGNLRELYNEHLELYDVMKKGSHAALVDIVERHIKGNVARLNEKIHMDYKDYFVF